LNKAIIIGGVIGAYGAKFLTKKYDVVVIEEHKFEDQPVHCAGLISKTGFERININPEKFVLNKIRGAKFFSKNKNFEIRTNETKAYVIDRKKFDNYLLNSAIDSGVSFINEKVVDIKIEKTWNVKTKEKNFNTKNLVLATGTNYKFHRKLGIHIPKFLTALQYEIPVECENDIVELHLTDDFFAWIIPVDDYARIGIASYKNVKEKFEKFVKNLKKERKIGEVLSKQSGLIPIYNKNFKTVYKFNDLNLRLVGDAAAQVKATTGGGVVMGCLAAKHLIDENYEKGWRNEIGKELYLHLIIRKFLNKNFSKYDAMLNFANIHKNIFYSSDMDMASKLLKNLTFEFIKNPKTVFDFLKIFIP